LSACSAPVFPGRASAKPKPPRRARAALARSWARRLGAWEPSAASPPTMTRCAPRGGTNASPLARHQPWSLRDAAWRVGRMRRKLPGPRAPSHAASPRTKRRPTHPGCCGLIRPGCAPGGWGPRWSAWRPAPHSERRPGGAERLRAPADEPRHGPRGRWQPAAPAPGGAGGGRPWGPLGHGVAPRGHRVQADEPAAEETRAPAPPRGQAAQDQGHPARQRGAGAPPV
jgi:hypothetical protein